MAGLLEVTGYERRASISTLYFGKDELYYVKKL